MKKLLPAPRDIVKFAMHTAVGATSAYVTDTAITAAVGPDESTETRTVSNVAATMVLLATWKKTDRLVDAIADRRIDRKAAKAEAKLATA